MAVSRLEGRDTRDTRFLVLDSDIKVSSLVFLEKTLFKEIVFLEVVLFSLFKVLDEPPPAGVRAFPAD